MGRRDNQETTLAEIIELLRAPPAPAPAPRSESEGQMLRQIIVGVVIMLFAAAGTWAGGTLNGAGSIGPKMDAMSKQLDGLSGKFDVMSQQSVSDHTTLSNHDVRIGAVERISHRLLDRMQAVESVVRPPVPIARASDGRSISGEDQ